MVFVPEILRLAGKVIGVGLEQIQQSLQLFASAEGKLPSAIAGQAQLVWRFRN